MTGKGTKKFRFPVAVHLDKAVGALTLHTGVGTYIISADRHKKCQRQSWRTSSPCQNVQHCKDGGSFREKQEIGRKKKRFATFHGGWALLRAPARKIEWGISLRPTFFGLLLPAIQATRLFFSFSYSSLKWNNMLNDDGKGNKKVPLSRCCTPWQGRGCINTPHGGRNLYNISR